MFKSRIINSYPQIVLLVLLTIFTVFFFVAFVKRFQSMTPIRIASNLPSIA